MAAKVAAEAAAVAGAEPGRNWPVPAAFRRQTAACALALVLAPVTGAADTVPDGGVALVVGNERYEHVGPLANTVTDARAVAQMLSDFGYRVHAGFDLDRKGFEDLLRTALLNVEPEDDVIFYFAGHGIQIGQRNYLVPVDARFDDIYDLPRYSITLDRVIEGLSARSSAHVAIVDACRENPFPEQVLATGLDASFYEAREGFQVMRTPINSLVAFSASPGELALDGEAGGHSPYTEALLASVRRTPDENLPNVLSEVRERVYAMTAGFQVPWESSTLVRPFILKRAGAAAEPPAPVAVSEAVEDPVAPTLEPATGSTEADTLVAALPEEATIALQFDRRVALGAQLSDTLQHPLDGAEIVTTPTRGRIELAEVSEAGATTRSLVPVNLSQGLQLRGGDITFRPALSEINTAAGGEITLADSFQLRLGSTDAAQTLTVNLELEVAPCDIQAGDALDLQGVGYFRWPNEIDPAAAMEACAAAVAAAPDTPRFLYQYGRAQLASRDFEGAYRSFRAAADAEHIRAFNALATLLSAPQIDRDVVDVPLDPDEARALRERGIAAGDPFAMHSLGLRLLRDGETDAEHARGFELLDRAAEMGHTFSMNELGYQFLIPESDRYQPARGMTYLTASSARDDIYGHHNLGLVALLGLDGEDPDHETARDYLLRAAEGGHPRAPGDLARMYARGQLGAPDLAEALRWSDVGLERGDGTAGANGVAIIMTGQLSGHGPADAAVRAAKVIEMPNSDAIDRARGQLAQIDAREQDRATQMLLVALGEPIAVDGAFGPASRAALERQTQRHGLSATSASPTDRLLLAARAHWAQNPLRLDLF